MRNWIKPEHFITVALAIIGWGALYLAARDTDTKHTTVSDITMSQVLTRLDRIDTSVQGIPLYAQRLAQLEDWQKNQLQYNGSIDTKLTAVTQAQGITQSQVDDLRRASGMTPDGKKMR